ncbi:MAG: hypothetical protein NUV69_02425 [Candidatus Curtissbacteria bacterium]|nr:hypothetical protein [Candidatus Curtissbacteria bacterium]
MTNFPKNPKPHIENNYPTTSTKEVYDEQSVLEEPLDLIRKNRKIVKENEPTPEPRKQDLL